MSIPDNGKILVFAHDPGGANMLLPIIEDLLANNINIKIFARGPAVKIWREMNWPVEEVIQSADDVRSTLLQYRPVVVLTGTSMSKSTYYGSNIDRDVWIKAHELNIKSISGIDAQMNIPLRCYHDVEGRNVQPDIFCVADQNSQDVILNEDWITAEVHIVGQPHLEREIDKIECGRNSHQSSTSRPLAVFFSEPVTLGLPEELYPGFDQFEVANTLIEALEGFSIDLHIKLHPHEVATYWEEFIARHQNHKALNVTISDVGTRTLHQKADMVFGIASMALIESSLAGIPTAALQLDPRISINPAIDNCSGISRFYVADQILDDIHSFVSNPTNPEPDSDAFAYINGSKDCFINIIQSTLSHQISN